MSAASHLTVWQKSWKQQQSKDGVYNVIYNEEQMEAVAASLS